MWFTSRRQTPRHRRVGHVKKRRADPARAKVLLRADSAFYGHSGIGAAVRAGAQISVTVRLDPRVKAAIAAIEDQAWTPIEYTDAIFDQATQAWISSAEVAKIPFTAFTAQKKATRYPDGRSCAGSQTSTPTPGSQP